jgi:hypothetical protein
MWYSGPYSQPTKAELNSEALPLETTFSVGPKFASKYGL